LRAGHSALGNGGFYRQEKKQQERRANEHQPGRDAEHHVGHGQDKREKGGQDGRLFTGRPLLLKHGCGLIVGKDIEIIIAQYCATDKILTVLGFQFESVSVNIARKLCLRVAVTKILCILYK